MKTPVTYLIPLLLLFGSLASHAEFLSRCDIQAGDSLESAEAYLSLNHATYLPNRAGSAFYIDGQVFPVKCWKLEGGLEFLLLYQFDAEGRTRIMKTRYRDMRYTRGFMDCWGANLDSISLISHDFQGRSLTSRCIQPDTRWRLQDLESFEPQIKM